jgi:hypothetical protein
MTEMHVGKMQFGLPRRVEPQTDALAGERIADVVVVTFVGEVAGAGDDLDLLVRGIDQRLVVLAKASAAGLVKLGRRVLVERLVGPIMVIGGLPAFKAPLLGRKIGGRRLGRLGFQIAMHALMRTVVLGRARPRELHFNPLLDPPQAQARQAAQTIGGER